ncbi:hypothetical protein [Butyrivibrio sp. XBB1001]|uniref:hypothetical protein n=1 Tax=Butyrivibrio sp. XBB1001 TaxID=1280682 RepID=UPI0003F4DFC3|nr:hypothetical protein [Butyrivibrio sp. XBB1001]
MEKNISEIDESLLENVSGGKGKNAKASNLVMKGSSPKGGSAVYSNQNRKASNLLATDDSKIDGKMILGDFNDRSNMC